MYVINDLGRIVNQDLSPSKHNPSILYDSVNFRITTEHGASSLSRTNIKGEIDLLNIPQLYSFWKISLISIGCLGGRITATQLYIPNSVSKIIGWVLMRDDIYIFTTPETTLVNTGYSALWKFNYNKASDYTDPT